MVTVTKNKKTFKVDVDGQSLDLAVMRPSYRSNQQSQIVYSKTFREAVEGGAILRTRLGAVMRDQNLWDDEKELRFQGFSRSLLDGEKRLKKGGLKLGEAREIAIQMRRDRYELRQMQNILNQADAASAETLADNAKFNFLVYDCTVYSDTGKRYFQNYEDYLELREDPVKNTAYSLLGNMIYGVEDDYEHKLPENKFLVQFKFCNKDLALVNKEGKMVDTEGNLVDDQGRLIDDQGRLIDEDGNLLTAEGEYDIETLPFLDDETGQPLVTGATEAVSEVVGDKTDEKVNVEPATPPVDIPF